MAEISPADDPLRELALVLHDVSWRVARFGPAQVGVEPLPTSELTVLRAVIEHPDVNVSEVAERLSMQPSNVSATVRSLLQRGLVDKRPDERDRRVSLLRPTAKALAERDAIEDAIAATVSAALNELPADQLAMLQQSVPALLSLTRALTAATGAATRA